MRSGMIPWQWWRAWTPLIAESQMRDTSAPALYKSAFYFLFNWQLAAFVPNPHSSYLFKLLNTSK